MIVMIRHNYLVQGNGGDRLARWLSLAAAPTFAGMALLSVLSGDANMICSGNRFLPVDGMTAMYGLMAVFHLSPWIKLLQCRSAL